MVWGCAGLKVASWAGGSGAQILSIRCCGGLLYESFAILSADFGGRVGWFQ